MRCERDTACDRLSQMHKQTLHASKTPAIVEGLHTQTRRSSQHGEGEEPVKGLEEQCAALKFQVASLLEARALQDEVKKSLKEEVLLLRDTAMQSSHKIQFLQREKEELHQLIQASCSGDVGEERQQLEEMLRNEAARRDTTSEQWRAYLSSRVQKVVQLEIEGDFLRDALASLQQGPHELGFDLSSVLDSYIKPEVASDDVEAPDLDGKWFRHIEQSKSEDCRQPGCHKNIARPVVRRRRKRSCERQLPPMSPTVPSGQFPGSPEDRSPSPQKREF